MLLQAARSNKCTLDSLVQTGRISYPLDPSVGSIGIAGVLGSSAGGGDGFLDDQAARQPDLKHRRSTNFAFVILIF